MILSVKLKIPIALKSFIEDFTCKLICCQKGLWRQRHHLCAYIWIIQKVINNRKILSERKEKKLIMIINFLFLPGNYGRFLFSTAVNFKLTVWLPKEGMLASKVVKWTGLSGPIINKSFHKKYIPSKWESMSKYEWSTYPKGQHTDQSTIFF